MYIQISGYCPTQGKEYTVSALLLDEDSDQIGRVECPYTRDLNPCEHGKCPIIEKSRYHY